VTLGLRGTVSCYDANTGKMLWRKEDFKGSLPRFFTSASPVIEEGLCIAQLGGGDNGGVIAYDLASGDEKWKWTGDAPAYASPVTMNVGGTKIFIAETEEKIVGLDLKNGKLLWEMPFAVQGRGYNASTPIVNGQTLIYCGSGRGATAVKIEKDGDNFTAKELWKNPDNSVQFNTPVLKEGYLYGLTAGNEFFCINAANGETAWTAPLSPPAAEAAATEGQGGGQAQGGRRRGGGGGRGGYGSIVDAGSVLIALTPASELVAFKPDSKSFNEVARIKVAESPTYAYPVVSGKRIIVKDQNDLMLYAVN
jgi:outer membrane protein assembly factor BamB